MTDSYSTKVNLRNSGYPSLWVQWRRPKPEDKINGPDMWIGEGTVWVSSSEKLDRTFTIVVGQSAPLGGIHFQLDPCGPGALDFGRFEGTGITERDLQWCSAWAGVTIDREIRGIVNNGAFPA